MSDDHVMGITQKQDETEDEELLSYLPLVSTLATVLRDNKRLKQVNQAQAETINSLSSMVDEQRKAIRVLNDKLGLAVSGSNNLQRLLDDARSTAERRVLEERAISHDLARLVDSLEARVATTRLDERMACARTILERAL